MHIVLTEDVVLPRYVFNLELGFAETTDEALTGNLLIITVIFISLLSERINDDTEEDIHTNNIDKEEETDIIKIPIPVQIIRTLPKIGPFRLIKGISDTTSCSHTYVDFRHQAFHERTTVGIEVRVIISSYWTCSNKGQMEIFEAHEGEDVYPDDKHEKYTENHLIVMDEHIKDDI